MSDSDIFPDTFEQAKNQGLAPNRFLQKIHFNEVAEFHSFTDGERKFYLSDVTVVVKTIFQKDCFKEC